MKELAEFALAGAAAGFAMGELSTIATHDSLSHRTIEIARGLRLLADIGARAIWASPPRFAAAHRRHHSIEDPVPKRRRDGVGLGGRMLDCIVAVKDVLAETYPSDDYIETALTDPQYRKALLFDTDGQGNPLSRQNDKVIIENEDGSLEVRYEGINKLDKLPGRIGRAVVPVLAAVAIFAASRSMGESPSESFMNTAAAYTAYTAAFVSGGLLVAGVPEHLAGGDTGYTSGKDISRSTVLGRLASRLYPDAIANHGSHHEAPWNRAPTGVVSVDTVVVSALVALHLASQDPEHL